MSSSEKIIIHTDGGSRGNPGPAALGVAFFNERGKMLKGYGKALGVRTNNEAEYEAVVFALQKAKAMFGGEKIKQMEFEIRSDSELIVSQLRGEYKIENEKLQPLFIKIWNLKIDFGVVKFTHVSREKNRDADRLVNEALDKEQTNLFGE
jgi:ribonuclease HI